MTIRPDMLHAEGQTNGRTERHDEADIPFSQFCKRATNCSPLYTIHECAVHIERHEMAPDLSIPYFLVTNEFENLTS